jgi:hypothetical protein
VITSSAASVAPTPPRSTGRLQRSVAAADFEVFLVTLEVFAASWFPMP